MFVIYDTLGVYGGSHTLMLRMAEWLNSRNIKMTIIGTSISNTEVVEKLEKENVKIIEGDLGNAKKGYHIISSLLEEEPIKMYCFSWNHYLDVERIKKKYVLEFDSFVYCIHPETFKKGSGFKTQIARKYSIATYRKILKRMNDNRSLISLDEINIKESESYLQCDLGNTTPIVYLPMYCLERSDAEEIIKYGYNSNVLLTAARADFPYKGYMVGLIDLFAQIKHSFPEIVLEIVASGDDIQILKDKIDSQNQTIRDSIRLYGWVEYDKLKALMRKCRVFIGMGTSVFDATLQYKPSIVVKFNTMECISNHFVVENPTFMTVAPECNESALKRIMEAFEWDFDEYRKQSYLSFSKTKEIYDINIRMEQLVNAETISKKSILTIKESIRHHMNNRLNSVRFKKVSASDFKNLVWEKGQSSQ